MQLFHLYKFTIKKLVKNWGIKKPEKKYFRALILG
jgi:hypothetical protein